jgi:predicted nucleotidyltransferase
MVEETIVAAVRRYLAALPQMGVHPRRAVLYGSFARGEERQYSDIDIVVIAPEFDTVRDIELIERLWQATQYGDNRIEPMACGEVEWETDGRRPIIEIARREGVVIPA